MRLPSESIKSMLRTDGMVGSISDIMNLWKSQTAYTSINTIPCNKPSRIPCPEGNGAASSRRLQATALCRVATESREMRPRASDKISWSPLIKGLSVCFPVLCPASGVAQCWHVIRTCTRRVCRRVSESVLIAPVTSVQPKGIVFCYL